MNISEKGLDFLKTHEGFKTEWYDLKDGGLTVGFGNFISYAEAETKGIKEGQKITEEEANDMLHSKVDSFVDGTNAQLKEYDFKVNQNQFDALVSYAYNRGLGNSEGTNGLRELLSNSKSVKEISKNFLIYWGSNETYKNGLMNRRTEEQQLFDAEVVEEKKKVEVKEKEKVSDKKKVEEKAKPKKYKVTADQLNIRKSPSNSGEILGTLKKNDTVEVISIDKDGWAKVKAKDGHNYVHSKHLTK